MDHLHRHGTARAFLRALALLALWLGLALPALAQTCPSADGAGYTIVDTGTANNYTLNAGQSLLIQAGTYTGFVNALPTGAFVCVNSGATFQPAGINNMAGTIENYGTTLLIGTNFSSGATFNNRQGLMRFENNNANGPMTITNALGATMEATGGVVGLSSGSNVTNDGEIDVLSGSSMDVQSGATMVNNGRMELNGGNLNTAGTVTNTGYVFGAGDVHVNGGSFNNLCSIVVSDISNNGILANQGQLMVEGNGQFTNQGTLTQGADGQTSGANFTNNNVVSGFGRYYFTGTTVNQGPFNGDSASAPIIFYDTTRVPPPEFFDTQNTNPTNTVRISFTPSSSGHALTQCTPVQPDEPQADASVTKTPVPTSARPGDTVTYTLAVDNAGPDGAEGTILTDAPGTGLTCSAVTCTAASGGAACPVAGSGTGQLSIANLLGTGVELEQLPAGGHLEFEVACTVD